MVSVSGSGMHHECPYRDGDTSMSAGVCVSQLCALCRYGAVTERLDSRQMGRREASAEGMSAAPASRFPSDAQVLFAPLRLCCHGVGGGGTPATNTA